MSRRFEIGVGLLVVGAVGILAYMALQIGAIRSLGDDPVEVVAVMDDVAGLSQGAIVAIAGVPIGRVDAMAIDFDKAKVSISLDASAGVRNDVILAMRARSVLGEKYLEIVPQSHDAPLLKDGDVITRTESSLEIDQLVTRLGPMLDAVDPALVNQVLRSLSDALREDPERLSRMLGDADHALHNLALASDQLDPTIADARSTLTSVRRTSDAARPVIQRADATVARLDELIASVPPDEVPKLLEDVHAAVNEGRAVIVKLDRSTGTIEKLVTKADSFSKEDWLRITQEEGVLIRIRKRDADKIAAEERAEDAEKGKDAP